MNTTTKKVFDLRFTLLLTLNGLILILLAIIFYRMTPESSSLNQKNSLREIGNKLQAAGIHSQANKLYIRYLAEEKIPAQDKATLSYTVAELYEREGNFEEALSWYYQSENYSTQDALRAEAKKKIVSLLEKLKKFSAARYALQESTSLENKDKAAAIQGGDIIAEIGEKKIYLHEVRESLDALPPSLREQFKTTEQKKEFAKKYVVDLLLEQKARRLGLDQEANVRKSIDNVEKQIIVQKLLEDEIHNKIKAEDLDIKNYYEANTSKYSRPERIKVGLVKVKDKKIAEQIVIKLNKGTKFSSIEKDHPLDDEIKNNLISNDFYLSKNQSFLELSPEQYSSLFKLKEDQWSEPLLAKGHYYIVKVLKHEEAKGSEYEKIKAQVLQDYKVEKAQDLYSKLVQETIQNENDKIKFYLEKIK